MKRRTRRFNLDLPDPIKIGEGAARFAREAPEIEAVMRETIEVVIGTQVQQRPPSFMLFQREEQER